MKKEIVIKSINISLIFLFLFSEALSVGMAQSPTPLPDDTNETEIPTDLDGDELDAENSLLLSETVLFPTMDTALNDLFRPKPALLEDEEESYPNANLTYMDNGNILVSVTTQNIEGKEQLKQRLSLYHAEIIAEYDIWLDISIPVQQLPAFSNEIAISTITQPQTGLSVSAQFPPADVTHLNAPLNVGSNTTQGVAKSNATAWHNLGITGSNVKVGILDFFQGYQTAQSLGELPANLSFYPNANSLDTSDPHGTAVAEIIYDLAPSAQFTLSSMSSGTCADLASRIVGLASSGVNIISSSVGQMQCGAGDGNPAYDPISSAVATAKNTYHTLFFQAAGNHALKHWAGTVTDKDKDKYLELNGGAEVTSLGYLNFGYPVIISMRWSEWPKAATNYDLVLVRWTGSKWKKEYTWGVLQSGNQPPTENGYVYITKPGTYGLAIRRPKGKFTSFPTFDFMNWYFNMSVNNVNYSLVGPATNPNTYAVAAADVSSGSRESYSSVGPTLGSGGVLSGGTNQPYITGYANVDTWAYGPGEFNGTSSATPHVAGVAALIWSSMGCTSPANLPSYVANWLKSYAQDIQQAGYDLQTGYGLLKLGTVPANTCNKYYFPILFR
jgi:hypothetical protein